MGKAKPNLIRPVSELLLTQNSIALSPRTKLLLFHFVTDMNSQSSAVAGKMS